MGSVNMGLNVRSRGSALGPKCFIFCLLRPLQVSSLTMKSVL